MDEKKMTLEELVGWLKYDGIPYEIDDAGKLTVKGDLIERFRNWAKNYKYTSLPDELVRVDGALWLEWTSIMSLGGLTSVGRGLYLSDTSIASLGNLISIGGNLTLGGTPLTSLGNLTSVGGNLNLNRTLLTSLGNLTSVGGDLDLKGASLTSLGRLTFVRGFCSLEETSITSLDSLTSVGGWLDLRSALLASLNDLPQVERDLSLDQSQLQLLTRGALQKVKGETQYWGQVENGWVTLSPDELETIIAENERRESLHSVRESDVDWDLYDR